MTGQVTGFSEDFSIITITPNTTESNPSYPHYMHHSYQKQKSINKNTECLTEFPVLQGPKGIIHDNPFVELSVDYGGQTLHSNLVQNKILNKFNEGTAMNVDDFPLPQSY